MNLWEFTANDKILQTPNNINYVDVEEFEWMQFAGELYESLQQHPYWNKGDIFMFLGKFEHDSPQNPRLWFINLRKMERWDLTISLFHERFRPVETPK